MKTLLQVTDWSAEERPGEAEYFSSRGKLEFMIADISTRVVRRSDQIA